MTFTSFSEGTENRWGGITFYNKSWDGEENNFIKSCIISNADDAIYCKSANPLIRNSTFNGNEDAIFADGVARVKYLHEG